MESIWTTKKESYLPEMHTTETAFANVAEFESAVSLLIPDGSIPLRQRQDGKWVIDGQGGVTIIPATHVRLHGVAQARTESGEPLSRALGSITGEKLAALQGESAVAVAAANAKATEAAQTKEAAFSQARESGKPVEFRRRADNVGDVGVGVSVEYAMPDGNVKTVQSQSH